MASTAAMWLPVVQELALRGLGSFPVELPGHGFDAQFPDGYQCPQDDAQLLSSRSPIASLSLDDYADHVLAIVRRVVAEQRRVILVGHSLGGNVVTRVANAVPELLSALVYVCAYCCVESPNVLAYAPRNPDPYSPLARARQLVWIGDPRQTGASRTNPRSSDADVLDAQHVLMMADIDRARVPAVLSYALQPDESLRAVAGEAQADSAAWGRVPRTYIRTTLDQVIPIEVQDRMIAEADALTPDNTFAVRDVEASHFVLFSRPEQIADLLATVGQPA